MPKKLSKKDDKNNTLSRLKKFSILLMINN